MNFRLPMFMFKPWMDSIHVEAMYCVREINTVVLVYNHVMSILTCTPVLTLNNNLAQLVSTVILEPVLV